MYTKKMTAIVAAVMITALLLAGCQPRNSNNSGYYNSGIGGQEIGILLGGIGGGIVGAQIGSGTANTVATIAGVLVGAAIGGYVGSMMDSYDHDQTMTALQNGQQSSWTNPNSGADYTFTPTNTYNTQNGLCREFTQQIYIDGRSETAYGTACKDAQGNWRIVDSHY